MKFNYNGLWKMLIDNNMKKKDSVDRTGVSSTTISKMVRGKAVSLIDDESYAINESDKAFTKSFYVEASALKIKLGI